MELISKEEAIALIKAEMDKIPTHNLVDGTARINLRLAKNIIEDMPSIDIVRCKECKHRPIKEDADGENYGFNLIEPNDGDESCPCLVSDGWYSWMPEDDFYCGYGEREGE